MFRGFTPGGQPTRVQPKMVGPPASQSTRQASPPTRTVSSRPPRLKLTSQARKVLKTQTPINTCSITSSLGRLRLPSKLREQCSGDLPRGEARAPVHSADCASKRDHLFPTATLE